MSVPPESEFDLNADYDRRMSTKPLLRLFGARKAARFVEEGLNNVGLEELKTLVDELPGRLLVTGSRHALVHGFLWYKGA
jgi:hypothetical protein